MSEKIKGAVRHLHASEQTEMTTHVKLYKANGRWLTALIVVTGIAVGVQSLPAQAATDSNVTTQQTATTATVTPTTSTNPSSAAEPESTPANTVPTTQDATTTTPVTRAVAQTNLGNASAETIEATKQAKTAVYQSTGQAQVITAVDPTASTNVSVTKDTFLDYFNLNGTASYDPSTGYLTLTTDDFNQDGNATLKNKVDLNQSFKLTGGLNLGTQAQKPGWHAGELGGGDGVAFAFHDGNTDEVGGQGASVGIGGLEGAFGWKADTFFNAVDEQNAKMKSYAKADPSEFGQNPLPKDPDGDAYVYGAGEPFGAFIYTDPTTENNMVTSYDPVDDPTGKAKPINQPSGQFEQITISYDGPSKTMTINFEGKTWTHKITDWTAQSAAAFLISGGTAGAKNLQQFRFDSFTYIASPSVNVKYVDEDNGNALIMTGNPTYTHADGTPIATDESVQLGDKYVAEHETIDGYVFDKIMENSLPENGTLKSNGDNGTVIYGYKHIVPVTPKEPYDADPTKLTDTATRTINYVYADGGATIAPSFNQSVTFTQTGTEDLLTKTVTYNNDWTTTNAQVPSVISPFIQGYAPDKETVPASAMARGKNQTVTVSYYPVGLDNGIKTKVGQPLYAIAFTLQPEGPNGDPIGNPIYLTGNPGEPIGFGSLTDIPGYFLVPNQNLVVPNEPNTIVPVKYNRIITDVPNNEVPDTNEPNVNIPEDNDTDQGHVVTGGDNGTVTNTEGGAENDANNVTTQGASAGTTTTTANPSAGTATARQTKSTNPAAGEQTLPQTSETSTQNIAAVGFLGLLASLFGLTGAKKRRQNL